MRAALYHAANLPKLNKLRYDKSMNENQDNSQKTAEESCIFCKIAGKEIPAQMVYEDANTLAFLDINPNNHGHTLVIPKHHFENIYTLPQEALCQVMLTVQKIALAVKTAAQADGINISMNNESAAGQEVFHAHIHVIPRHESDEFPHFPHRAYIGDEMKQVAEKIKKEIHSI
jgi:histidine triad (HIT) family protein